MKPVILSCIVMSGLATLIYSKPVNDINSIKYQVVKGLSLIHI